MTADEHPVLRLARLVNDHGGAGMEWRERPFDRGAEIRVWLPDLTGASVVFNEARWGGLHPEEPVPHLEHAGSVSYDGYQIAVTIPLALVASARDLMARGLPAGPAPRELGTGGSPLPGA